MRLKQNRWVCRVAASCNFFKKMMVSHTFSSHSSAILRGHGLALGRPRWLSGKDSACQCRRCRCVSLIPGLRSSPGGGNDNPLQYSCLENPQGQKSLAGYSPWGHKESDTTEQLTHTHEMYRNVKWFVKSVFLTKFTQEWSLDRISRNHIYMAISAER